MINTDIYGAPETWTTAQYLTFAKYANFGTVANPQNTFLEGSTAEKTPTGELVENSICSQALGAESLYSNVVWVHDYGGGQQYVVDEKPQVSYFFAECVTTADNIQNNESHINLIYNYNSWKPYITDESYQNKSAYSKPIVEYQPKKIIYRIFMTVCDTNGNKRPDPILLDRADLPAEQEVLIQYPYIANAYMRVYVDSSDTDTPQRSQINSNSLFGVCTNVGINAETDNINIDYAFFRSMQYNHIPIYGCFGINYFDNHYTACLCGPTDIVIDSHNVSTRHLWNDEFKEFLIKQAACFGGFVYISQSTGVSILDISLDSDDIICGILDENGVGHGEYTRGAANRTNPIWEWETNRDSPFDPYKIPDPTRYDTTTVFGNNSLYNTFIQYYACSPDGLKTLCNYIYNYINSINPETDDITKSIVKTFYTNNPLDVIVSLKRFPFNITNYFTSGAIAPVNIRLGELVTSGYGWALSGQYTVVDFGQYLCYPVFDDSFLDYSPYTYYELIIPFCGSTRIDPALFMGKTLKLKMVVDLYTGACTCYILADSLCIDSVSGNCAIDIPITGIQSADFQNSVQNAITNVKNARINTETYNLKGQLAMGVSGYLLGDKGAVIGNVVSSIGTSLSLSSLGNLSGAIAANRKTEKQNYIAESKANYDLEHVQTPFNSVGSQSAANSYIEEMQPRLIIYRPKFINGWNPETYGKTVGFACMLDGQVKDFDGFTIANIDVSGINASAEEKQMIAAAFANGVYL